MKKMLLSLLCAMALGFGTVSAASAADLLFSIGVPEAWSVGMVSPDGACTISIIAEKDDGTQKLEDLATAFAGQFGGTKPQKLSANEYSTTYEADGQKYVAVISLKEGTFYLVTVAGEHPDTAAILTSLHYLTSKR